MPRVSSKVRAKAERGNYEYMMQTLVETMTQSELFQSFMFVCVCGGVLIAAYCLYEACSSFAKN